MTEQSPGCVDIPSESQEAARGDFEWKALKASLENAVPLCDGQALFTADGLTDEERATCASICARCPVSDPCGAYATAAKVPSGFWAGHAYNPKGRR